MNTIFSKKLFFLLTLFLTVATVAVGADKKFTLVLDAGHGGHDSGCLGSGLQEKDINLRAVLMLGRLIKEGCPDVNLIYTRQTDVFIPLHKRADVANKAKADLFISLHTNSAGRSSVAKGFETWTMGLRRSDEKLSAAKRENDVILIEQDYQEHYAGYDPNSPESNIMFEFMLEKNMDKSVELASLIQNRVCGTYGRASRGVRQDVFLVLRETSMPACLVELGFITNSEENRLMAADSTLAPTVQGIYEAFVQYKNKYTGSNTPITRKPSTPSAPSVKPQAETRKPEAAKVESKKEEPKKEETKKEVAKKEVAKKEDTKKENAQKTEKAQTAQTSKPQTSKPQEKEPETSKPQTSKPHIIYKVQILAVNRTLRSDSELLKGHSDATAYREGNMMKYTVGESDDYEEMARLRKKLQNDFPEAFVVAFCDGEKMAANEARELQKKQKK